MLRKVALLPLLALLMVPAVGHALGLGEVRVLSSLNEPLEAEIALSDLRAGELDALQVRLASTEAFARVGLDRPFLLTQLQFEAARNDANEPVVRVTTQEAVREPFLNFLIEANWSRGRLLREYTVLLDPPVLMPAIAESMRPARTEPAPRPERTETQTPARQNPPSLGGRIPEDRMRAGPGSYGAIQRDETLWSIAERVKPSAEITTSQMMLALFEANPDAFYGNINRMKTGYILRVPARDAVMQRSAAEAVQEVARQNEAWRTGEAIDFRIAEAGPAAGDDQLRLTAPAADAGGDDPAGTGDGADTGLQGQLAAAEDTIAEERAARESLADRLVELETETERLRRELEIRNAELAAVASGTAMPERPAQDTPADTTPAEEQATQQPAEEPAADPRRSVRTTPPEEPTLLETLMSPFWLAVLAGVLVLLVIGTFAVRQHRARSEANRALAPEVDDDATQFDAAEAVDVEGEQTVLRPDDEAFDGAVDAAPEPEPEPEPAPEEDLDTSGVMALDEGDPASEADFHLAYGLYDQAADLMEGAYKQHPDRVDYLMKLLEIYFSWGKADEFIAHARDGRGKLEAAGEWGNVAILGRQMKADEPLFSDMAGTGARAGVDLDVEDDAGGQAMDLDTGTFEGEFDLGEPDAADAPAEPAAAPAGNEVEFDLGDFDYDAATAAVEPVADLEPAAEPESEPESAPEPAAEDDNALDFDLDLGDDATPDEPAEEAAEATQFKVEPSADDSSFDMDFDAALEGLETEGDSADIEASLAGDDGADTALGAGGATADDDGIELDFDSLLADDGDAEPEPEADAGGTDSRLDLARAYIDMGDADGARTLLDEVVAGGDDAQKAEAQELLKLIS